MTYLQQHRGLRQHIPLLLLLLLAGQLRVSGQDLPGAANYFDLYKKAENNYQSPNATTTTDSIALGLYKKVIAGLEKTPTNKLALNGRILLVLFDSYLKAGILEMSAGDDRGAISLFSQSVILQQHSSSLSDSLDFQPYVFAGGCYYNLYDLDSAQFFYRLAERLVEKNPGISGSERLYNKSGALFYEIGDYRRSIQYFRKALAIVQAQHPQNGYFIVNYQNNIASALLKLQEYDQAIEIYKNLLVFHTNRNELLHNIGATYLAAGRPVDAIHYLQQVRYNSPAKYNHLAGALIELHKPAAAADNLRLALLEYGKSKIQSKNPDRGDTYRYFGDLRMAEKDPAGALRYYQRAVIQFDRDFNDTAVDQNPRSFSGLHNSFVLFDALAAKAGAFEAMEEYEKASETYGAALALAVHVERLYNSDEAKLFLVKKVSGIYKKAIGLSMKLYSAKKDNFFLTKVFGYIEESKSSVLQADLGGLDPGSLQGPVRTLLREAKSGRSTVAKLTIRMAATTDSAVYAKIQMDIRDLELHISGLDDKLDQYPEYARSKFDPRTVTIAAIQKEILQKNACLLSFYYTDEQLYCFYITPVKFGCVVQPLKRELSESILSLRRELDVGSADRRRMDALTHTLYGQLIAPVYEQVKGLSRMIVIPYNEIGYIPFEILDDVGTEQPLLNHFSISYAYSANTLLRPARADGKSLPSSESYKVLAVAPFSGPAIAGASFSPLPSSGAEVSGLKGRVLSGREGTKDAVLKLLPSFPVLHLATHAVVNDRDPVASFIEFYNGDKTAADSTHRLYEQEIYHLDMESTSLVILSACETGSGQLINGEGIISLSRAFSYAGCKSVITSLWKADDEATAFIGGRVHYYLQMGEAKDRALQQAKIDYLKDPSIETRYKVPSFWATLVLVGDLQSVTTRPQRNWGWWILLVGALAFVPIGWFINKKNRARFGRTR